MLYVPSWGTYSCARHLPSASCGVSIGILESWWAEFWSGQEALVGRPVWPLMFLLAYLMTDFPGAHGTPQAGRLGKIGMERSLLLRWGFFFPSSNVYLGARGINNVVSLCPSRFSVQSWERTSFSPCALACSAVVTTNLTPTRLWKARQVVRGMPEGLF